jgi:hypothetical protein
LEEIVGSGARGPFFLCVFRPRKSECVSDVEKGAFPAISSTRERGKGEVGSSRPFHFVRCNGSVDGEHGEMLLRRAASLTGAVPNVNTNALDRWRPDLTNGSLWDGA